MPIASVKAKRPFMPCRCGPTTNPDPNVRGLYCWDGNYFPYVRDIPKSQCPLFPTRAVAVSIVANYVKNNALPASELPSLLTDIHATVVNIAKGAGKTALVEKSAPAVAVKKSITPDHLFSLEDGKPYRTLKRHLARLGMTPADYREKWGLASDYPMVAPNYAKTRSELAKSLGLGKVRKTAPSVVPAPPAPEGRGRKKAN